MKPVLLTICLVLLTACSTNITTVYYQLSVPDWQDKSSTLPMSNQRQLMIEPVMVSDFLAGNGIVMQTSPVRYTIANNHLWGSPLDQQLQQTLMENLSRALPNWVISTQNTNAQQATLSISVTGFQGGQDGEVLIKGIWTYQLDDKVLQQPFFHRLKQSEAGYEGLVNSLSTGWTDIGNEIAAVIKTQ